MAAAVVAIAPATKARARTALMEKRAVRRARTEAAADAEATTRDTATVM